MDILHFFSEIVIAISKHGWSFPTFVIILALLVRFDPVRKIMIKILIRYLPKKFRIIDNRMDRMEGKIDAIARHLGVGECVERNDLLQSSGRNLLISSTKGRLFARIADVFIRKESTTILRGNQEMKKKLLSRKFLMALISAGLVIANDGLGLGLDQNTIIAFGSIVVGYIVGEAATDVAKAKNAGFDDTKTH